MITGVQGGRLEALALQRLESFQANSKFGQHTSLEKKFWFSDFSWTLYPVYPPYSFQIFINFCNP